MSNTAAAFRGVQQLLGEEHFRRLTDASVCVIGLGGVGSWSVEALARSGVGALTLVDLDEVCETNVNRQLHAFWDTVGRSKVELLVDRVTRINPSCKVTAVKKFFSSSTAEEILSQKYSVVLDAIDRNENKTLLLGECVSRGLPVVTVGSGGDRVSAREATVVDLAKTIHDPLLQIVRKQLRQRFGFPAGERARFHIPCVYIPRQRGPRDEHKAAACVGISEGRKSCNDGLGSAVYVTGALGFMAAEEVIRIIGLERSEPLYPWARKQRNSSSPPATVRTTETPGSRPD